MLISLTIPITLLAAFNCSSRASGSVSAMMSCTWITAEFAAANAMARIDWTALRSYASALVFIFVFGFGVVFGFIVGLFVSVSISELELIPVFDLFELGRRLGLVLVRVFVLVLVPVLVLEFKFGFGFKFECECEYKWG